MNESSVSPEAAPISMRSIGVFVVLTAVFLIALTTLTSRLSQHPRYVPSETSLIPQQWEVVTNQERTFTFNMPEQWQRYEQPSEPFALALEENRGVETAVSLFRRIDAQTEIKMLAIVPSDLPHAPFIFVAQSRRMRQLTPTQLAAAIGNEVDELQQIELKDRPGGQQQVNFMLKLPIYADNWQCLYQYAINDEAGFVLAGCAPLNNFGIIGNDLLDVQDSFQLLLN